MSLKYNGSDIYHIIYNNQPVKQINYNSNIIWDYRTAAQHTYSIGYITSSNNNIYSDTVQVPQNNSIYPAGTGKESRILRGGVISFYNNTPIYTYIYFIGTQCTTSTDAKYVDTVMYAYDSSLNAITNGYASSSSNDPLNYNNYTVLASNGYNDDGANASYYRQPSYKFCIMPNRTVYIAFSSFNAQITNTSTLSYRIMQEKNKLIAPSITILRQSYDSYSGSYFISIKITNNEPVSRYIYYNTGSGHSDMIIQLSAGGSSEDIFEVFGPGTVTAYASAEKNAQSFYFADSSVVLCRYNLGQGGSTSS